MIRLAIFGVDDSVSRSIYARLHEAEKATLNECDAAVVLDSVDAVSIAVRCVQAGRHVLVSGNLRCAPGEAERLISASRTCGHQLAIANLDRYLPSYRLIKEHLDAGKLGTIGLLRMHFWEPLGASRSFLPILDLTMWFVGQPPEVIYTIGEGPDDYTQVHLGFANGAMALLNGVAWKPPSHPYSTLTVIGSQGAAYADDRDNVQLLCQGNTCRTVPANQRISQYTAFVQDFVDGLEAKNDFAFSVENWQRVRNVVQAAERSGQSRKAVRLEGV